MVVLNWLGGTVEKLELYADQYHAAAKALAENYDGTGPDRDFGACPVVFLYRHALELYLKGFILEGVPLVRLRRKGVIDVPAVLRSHELVKLIPQLETLIDSLGWDWDFGEGAPRSRPELEQLLREFDEIDRHSAAFRYPINTGGELALPEEFRFDLALFCQALDPLLEALDGGITGVAEALKAEREVLQERRGLDM